MRSNEQIITDLRVCFVEGNREFDLLNNYKGVPIISKAQLEKVTEDKVVFRVQPPGSVCLQWEEHTLLLSEGVLEPIDGRVRSFDISTGTVELGHFIFAGYRFGNRREVRVVPKAPLDIELKRNTEIIRGELADISMGGLGVTITSPEHVCAFDQGELVDLRLHLPPGEINLTGRVLRIEMGSGTCRLSIEFTESVPEKVLVLRYIFDRREEIRTEVQEMYAASYRAATAEA